jgi:hypothetical protein
MRDLAQLRERDNEEASGAIATQHLRVLHNASATWIRIHCALN